MGYLGQSFAREYIISEGRAQVFRIAKGLLGAWGETPLNISGGETFVGQALPDGVAGFNFGSGLYFDGRRAEGVKAASPGDACEIDRINEYFRGQTTGDVFWSQFTDDERAMSGENVLWAGGWGGHILLDYDMLLTLGTKGLREKVNAAKTDNSSAPDFYDAMIIMCDTIDLVADRYKQLALTQADIAETLDDRERLLNIADVLSRVPYNPAGYFDEAVQAFWLIFAIDGFDSPGRFDQYMLRYWQASCDAGEYAACREKLEELWRRFEAVRAWNLCVGGVDKDGNDASNGLSWEILDIAGKYKFAAPNLTMRVHPGTPKALLHKAMETISTGIGMPALYNDETVIPALVAHGIPLEDARGYAMNGCNQFDIAGKSHMGLEDGEISLIKCLELALNDGYCRKTGRQIGPRTGDPASFRSTDELVTALKEQIRSFVSKIAEISNRFQKAFSETGPAPLRSLLVQGCLEKGVDVKSGGALYNHGQVLIQGIGNTADSLAAIDRLVFRSGLVSMRRLVEALRSDWVGFEELRALVLKCPKFGNDDDTVDCYAADIVGFTMEELKKYRTFRGGYFAGGSSVFVRGISFGANTGATPDGRKAGSPLADSVGPVQGRDRKGPTAVLNSCAKVDQKLAVSGYVLNLKLTKGVIDSAGIDRALALVQGYFKRGGQQLQIAVVNSEELKKAQERPEDYRGLIVRIGGYSDYFVNVSRPLQDEIISRVEHAI